MPTFPPPIDKALIAREAAKILLEIGAVHFYADKPFILTSGKASPVYTDCRRIISFPRARATLMDFAVATILQEIGYEKLDVVTGGETAGIPFAAWLSERLLLPMQYVRKKPKGFGRNAQIEGLVSEGQRAILVEDLATDGGSKVGFVKTMREAGLVVEHCFVIFFYDIFPEGRAALDDLGVTLHALTTWRDVLAVAKAAGTFAPTVLAEVESFLDRPAAWSAANGGKVE